METRTTPACRIVRWTPASHASLPRAGAGPGGERLATARRRLETLVGSLKAFLYGMTGYEFERHALGERARLEDLFVLPENRGQGHGKALLRELARLALQRGCGRLEWSVLNWNEPALEFYRSLGAKPMSEWTVYRLSGDALQRLGE